MDAEQFKGIVNEQFTMCCDMLRVKETLYSDGRDRLIQFKRAADLMGVTLVTALAGMMVKHTTKLYQMVDEGCSDRDQWDETLTDHINYLFLLRAVLAEIGIYK